MSNGVSNRSLVSVLIPCYNAEPYIAETINSVYNQTWPNIEIIVVDDGSTDKSVEIISSLRRPNLRLVRQANKGQTAALNVCISHASGDFIQYLDADDVLHPQKIETQLTRLEQRPGFIASSAWGRFYSQPSATVFKPEPVWRDLSPLDWIALSRADGLGMMFPALWLIPIEIVRASGPWIEDLTLNNDAEYFTRAILNSKGILFCEGARCYYRSGLGNSLSARRSSEAWKSQFRVLDLCESRVRALEDSERIRQAFALSWQHLAHSCYPYNPELAEKALARAGVLHKMKILPDGGVRFKILCRILGWRLARKLQVITGRA
jgi:glycosyltransferase involved in cell wall biosynthesis